MRVTIRLFGRLHDLAGAAQLERNVPAAATAGDAWRALEAEVPAVTPYAHAVSVAVNADFAKMATTLTDGDEVAFLPPVSGG
jgi:molybdopterin converting factor subunit 1